jgi:3-isopropylmalate/(R)-2-methylmalate dehydratase small subunit
MGFPQVTCPGIIDSISRWDEVEVDWANSKFVNYTADITLPIEPLSNGDRLMLEAGGLIGYIHARNKEETIQ